jgi:hypothetical protein
MERSSAKAAKVKVKAKAASETLIDYKAILTLFVGQ